MVFYPTVRSKLLLNEISTNLHDNTTTLMSSVSKQPTNRTVVSNNAVRPSQSHAAKQAVRGQADTDVSVSHVSSGQGARHANHSRDGPRLAMASDFVNTPSPYDVEAHELDAHESLASTVPLDGAVADPSSPELFDEQLSPDTDTGAVVPLLHNANVRQAVSAQSSVAQRKRPSESYGDMGPHTKRPCTGGNGVHGQREDGSLGAGNATGNEQSDFKMNTRQDADFDPSNPSTFRGVNFADPDEVEHVGGILFKKLQRFKNIEKATFDFPMPKVYGAPPNPDAVGQVRLRIYSVRWRIERPVVIGAESKWPRVMYKALAMGSTNVQDPDKQSSGNDMVSGLWVPDRSKKE